MKKPLSRDVTKAFSFYNSSGAELLNPGFYILAKKLSLKMPL